MESPSPDLAVGKARPVQKEILVPLGRRESGERQDPQAPRVSKARKATRVPRGNRDPLARRARKGSGARREKLAHKGRKDR